MRGKRFETDVPFVPLAAYYTKHLSPLILAYLSVFLRFNRLVWGFVCAERPMGVLAAGLENGELNLWDAQKIIDGAEE